MDILLKKMVGPTCPFAQPKAELANVWVIVASVKAPFMIWFVLSQHHKVQVYIAAYADDVSDLMFVDSEAILQRGKRH